MNNNSKILKFFLALFSLILLLVIIFGLLFLVSSETGTTSVLLSYVTGLSMIFLPCTLPLVFIIVPLTMSETPKKGLIMALLFGLGISITLAIYGVITAGVGSFLGVDKTTRIMFTIAGIASFLFGLSELKLLKFSIPKFSGGIPKFIQNRKDYTRIFFLGLFLGNAGVGCPNPAFYVLFTYIASVGDVVTGAWLAFIHGLGRATPLIFLAILGLLGINSMNWVTNKKAKIDIIMGWGLIIIGVFIFAFGLFGMPWWEQGPIHIIWNELIYNISPNLAELKGHAVFVPQGFVSGPVWSGWAFSFVIIVFVILISKIKKHNNKKNL